MKKIMVLLVLGCLLFGPATMASAETTIYLDVAGNGNYTATDKDYTYSADSTNEFKYDGDLSGFILGLESSFEKFKVGFEYGKIGTNDYSMKVNGTTDDNYNFNNSFVVTEIKGGYRVIDQDMWKLDLIASILDINSDTEYEFLSATDKIKFNIGGSMLGADFVVNFSSKIMLRGTLATSLLGANYGDFYYSMGPGGSKGDTSLTEIKLKFNYFFNDNWAIAAGYRSYMFSNTDDEKELDYKLSADGSITILTIGAVYKF
jgi:hypothetical protein